MLHELPGTKACSLSGEKPQLDRHFLGVMMATRGGAHANRRKADPNHPTPRPLASCGAGGATRACAVFSSAARTQREPQSVPADVAGRPHVLFLTQEGGIKKLPKIFPTLLAC